MVLPSLRPNDYEVGSGAAAEGWLCLVVMRDLAVTFSYLSTDRHHIVAALDIVASHAAWAYGPGPQPRSAGAPFATMRGSRGRVPAGHRE